MYLHCLHVLVDWQLYMSLSKNITITTQYNNNKLPVSVMLV